MTPRIRVTTTLAAPPDRVWADLRNISSHVEWMQDAVAIRFTSGRHEGVGTEFECDTAVGPFRLTDRMTVTGWVEGKEMAIRHTGVITGTGVFTLQRKGRRRTRFTWTERLEFPWWLGGVAGAYAARPVLRFVWRRNLRNLRGRFADR